MLTRIVRTSTRVYFSELLWTSEIWTRYSMSEIFHERDIPWTNYSMSEIFHERTIPWANYLMNKLFGELSENLVNVENVYLYWIYDANYWKLCITMLKMYICIRYKMPTIWGVCVSSRYMWHWIHMSNTNIHFQNWTFPNPVPEGHKEALQLAFS